MVDSVERENSSNKKLKFLLAVLLMAIIGFAGGIITASIINQNSRISEEKIQDLVLEGRATTSQLEQYISDFDKRIARAETKEEKAELYSERGSNLYNYIDLNENETIKNQVFADAYLAEELNPTVDTAVNIYYYENEYGSKERAEHYLQEAKNRGLDDIKGDG